MAVGKFLEKEKINQAEFKSSSKYFSEEARKDGVYRQKSWPFCLPRSHAEENLFEGIRGPAIDFFKSHEIKWHDGENGKPSNHLCDSQVCCVNFLFPFAQNSQALTELLRPLFPNIQKMLPIEDGLFVSFEWIGKENYLNEGNALNGKRTRGANFTSADAAVMFERTDGKCRNDRDKGPLLERLLAAGDHRCQIDHPVKPFFVIDARHDMFARGL